MILYLELYLQLFFYIKSIKSKSGTRKENSFISAQGPQVISYRKLLKRN